MHIEHFRLLLQAALSTPVPTPVQDAGAASAITLIASFVAQVKVNGVASVVIQALKKLNTPATNWINDKTPWVSRVVVAVSAAITAAGIKWVYTAGTLTITGLGVTTIVPALWAVAQNYLMQHAWYKLLFSGAPAAPAPAPAAPAAANG